MDDYNFVTRKEKTMTNKKICLALVAAALVCGIILPACKDDPVPGASDLVGKWGINEEVYFEFKADGKLADEDGEDTGIIYSTSGSTLTLTYVEENESTSGEFKFDGFDTLIISGFAEYSGMNDTYTRIK
jgi:hypothetical protein